MAGGTSPNYEDWKRIAILKAWELASLMQDFDPRALSDVVVHDSEDPKSMTGVPPDFSFEIRRINSAAFAGTIKSADSSIHNLEAPDTNIITASIGDWLVQTGYAQLASALELPRTTHEVPPIRINTSVLATPEELVAAFGTFTGMNTQWFKNLKDKPALKKARKQLGQGQRGHTIQPLFCPYEVMLWLINPKRRTGRALGEEKGWELLEKHFPSTYVAWSISDPRDPGG